MEMTVQRLPFIWASPRNSNVEQVAAQSFTRDSNGTFRCSVPSTQFLFNYFGSTRAQHSLIESVHRKARPVQVHRNACLRRKATERMNKRGQEPKDKQADGNPQSLIDLMLLLLHIMHLSKHGQIAAPYLKLLECR